MAKLVRLLQLKNFQESFMICQKFKIRAEVNSRETQIRTKFIPSFQIWLIGFRHLITLRS